MVDYLYHQSNDWPPLSLIKWLTTFAIDQVIDHLCHQSSDWLPLPSIKWLTTFVIDPVIMLLENQIASLSEFLTLSGDIHLKGFILIGAFSLCPGSVNRDLNWLVHFCCFWFQNFTAGISQEPNAGKMVPDEEWARGDETSQTC